MLPSFAQPGTSAHSIVEQGVDERVVAQDVEQIADQPVNGRASLRGVRAECDNDGRIDREPGRLVVLARAAAAARSGAARARLQCGDAFDFDADAGSDGGGG